jgi:hypothetical protein
VDAQWTKPFWNGIASVDLRYWMGEKPQHFPKTQVKMAYDDTAIYGIFKVEDRYVKAVHTRHQQAVYEDSCVEWFFSPEAVADHGYFHLEINCGATMLFYYRPEPGAEAFVEVQKAHLDKINIASTLPKKVDPEIDVPTTWILEFAIPFSVVEAYHNFKRPQPGNVWRVNFFKCADKTSQPHWLTWAPVHHHRPNFHLPEYFGILEFQ